MAEKTIIYFISDVHLGINVKGCEQREKHLFEFFDSIKDTASHVFILGDLFDFWIEYAHAIRPVYFPALYEIRKLIECGVEVHYLEGNHDFALGPFLKNTLGLHIHTGYLPVDLQGKKILLYHGDGIFKSDVVYRIWKRILRSRINQRLYKLIHPDIGVWFGTLCSGTSRHMGANRYTQKRRDCYREHARTHLANGYDIMIMAHIHYPEIIFFENSNKFYCNTGEWMHTYSYATLHKGNLSLWEYRPGREPLPIKPQDIK